MPYRLVEYRGKLAATLGWAIDWKVPQRSRTVWVSDIPIGQYRSIVGKEIVDLRGDRGRVRIPGRRRPLWINLKEWRRVVESTPVKKPRRGTRQGMRYDWKWVRGKWERDWLD